MTVIVDLVLTGIKKLTELVPLWIGASAEQRAVIEGKAKSLVEGLDGLFKSADAKDQANTDAAKKAIADAVAAAPLKP